MFLPEQVMESVILALKERNKVLRASDLLPLDSILLHDHRKKKTKHLGRFQWFIYTPHCISQTDVHIKLSELPTLSDVQNDSPYSQMSHEMIKSDAQPHLDKASFIHELSFLHITHNNTIGMQDGI
jgi:hypothetical protein